MLRVTSVTQSGHENLIAIRATNIFGRAGIGAFTAIKRLGKGIRRNNIFQLDPMIPVVTKVVKITKRSFCAHSLERPQTYLRDDRQILRVRRAVALPRDFEIMRMIIHLSHHDLNHVVQPAQDNVSRHCQSPPDGWSDALKLTVQYQGFTRTLDCVQGLSQKSEPLNAFALG